MEAKRTQQMHGPGSEYKVSLTCLNALLIISWTSAATKGFGSRLSCSVFPSSLQMEIHEYSEYAVQTTTGKDGISAQSW
jgi:hypothetical protein